MSQPNPEVFAKVVLWHLCGLRADVILVKQDMIERQAKETGKPSEEIFQKVGKQHRKLRDNLYQEALLEAGLPPDARSDPPSSDTGDLNRGGPVS
jgi:hypothetical protein